MGLEIHYPKAQTAGGLVADRPLYLDKGRTRLVEATDPAVGWLLVWTGHEVPAAEVTRLGLVLHEGRVMQVAPMDPPAVMPGPAAEMAPESPAAPAESEMAPIMAPEATRPRRRRRA